jgi:hypothetical protein
VLEARHEINTLAKIKDGGKLITLLQSCTLGQLVDRARKSLTKVIATTPNLSFNLSSEQ